MIKKTCILFILFVGMFNCTQALADGPGSGVAGFDKGFRDSGSFVITSDPQYPWTDKTDRREPESDSEKKTRSEQLIRAQYNSINAYTDTIKNTITPVLVNGDITAFGHGPQILGLGAEDEWGKMVELMNVLKSPVYPGLGNHDIQNNYNDCADNGCIYNSFMNYFSQVIYGVPTTSFDMKMNNPNASTTDPTQEYSGSFAYSTDMGPIHSIQLNNYPTMTFPDKTVSTKMGRIKFTLESSLDWLEQDLKSASASGQAIIINLHEPNNWGWDSDKYPQSQYPNLESGPNQRFINLLKEYDVKAVFAGHYHTEHGLSTSYKNYFGDVPVFISGSAAQATYLIAEYNSNDLKVYGVNNNDWQAKTLLKTIGIPYTFTIDKGQGRLVFKQIGNHLVLSGYNATNPVSNNDVMWRVMVNGKQVFTFSETTPIYKLVDQVNAAELVGDSFSVEPL
ncbi:metallophosphoesterase [Bacillus sp. FSL K6-0268]|uniref:metallophosphoesterase n=1 Tax=Bacillus sp. FSL K6-0268 TaxID=2921449 RepID=UPI0030FB3431